MCNIWYKKQRLLRNAINVWISAPFSNFWIFHPYVWREPLLICILLWMIKWIHIAIQILLLKFLRIFVNYVQRRNIVRVKAEYGILVWFVSSSLVNLIPLNKLIIVLLRISKIESLKVTIGFTILFRSLISLMDVVFSVF